MFVQCLYSLINEIRKHWTELNDQYVKQLLFSPWSTFLLLTSLQFPLLSLVYISPPYFSTIPPSLSGLQSLLLPLLQFPLLSLVYNLSFLLYYNSPLFSGLHFSFLLYYNSPFSLWFTISPSYFTIIPPALSGLQSLLLSLLQFPLLSLVYNLSFLLYYNSLLSPWFTFLLITSLQFPLLSPWFTFLLLTSLQSPLLSPWFTFLLLTSLQFPLISPWFTFLILTSLQFPLLSLCFTFLFLTSLSLVYSSPSYFSTIPFSLPGLHFSFLLLYNSLFSLWFTFLLLTSL